MPYNPQQNGVAERKNRTICEAAKPMFSDLSIPLSLWMKLHILLYTFKIEAPMPYWGKIIQKELFTGNKNTVDHTSIFGTPMYIHVPK